MQKLYCVSGLGADERVFTYLTVSGVEKVCIRWETPLLHESLPDYSTRLIAQIDQTQPVWLLGVSFGGIIAQEISRLISCEKLIIISSVKSRQEMTWQLRLVSQLRLHRIFPFHILKFLNGLTADYYFGTYGRKEDSALLKRIIADTDETFAEWAIERLMQWEGAYELSPAVTHIHGTKDKIFPVKSIADYTAVPGGEHFMIVSRAQEVSTHVAQALACAY